MTVREASLADIPAMHRVRLAVRENTLSHPARVTDADYVEALDVAGRTLVAEADGEIVAFATGHRNGSVWALFVHPDHEGRGYGTALLGTMVEWVWDLGHTQLPLTTQPGTRAERFYAARGWKSLGLVATGELRLELVKRTK